MATQGGPAKPVSVQSGGRRQGGPAIPVAVVNGRAIEGGPAMAVYEVIAGPVQAGPAMPIVAAVAGRAVVGGPAVPVYVVSGSLNPTPPASFTPASIAGLQFWLKSSALVLENNAPVSSWTDSSGNGNAATQGTGSLQPLYKTNQINTTLPSVLWDGSNDRLTTPSIAHNIGTGDFTIYVVARSVSTVPSYKTLLSTGSGGDPGLYFSQNKIDFFWGADKIFNTTITDSIWYFVMVERSGGTISLYLNGATDPTTFALATSMANGAWYIGNESSGTAATLNGDIAEAGLYNVGLTAGQRAQMNAYMSTTYGIF